MGLVFGCSGLPEQGWGWLLKLDRIPANFRARSDFGSRCHGSTGANLRQLDRKPAFKFCQQRFIFVVGAGDMASQSRFLAKIFRSDGEQIVLVGWFQEQYIHHSAFHERCAVVPDQRLSQIAKDVDTAHQGARKPIALGNFITMDTILRGFRVIQSEYLLRRQ